MDRTSSPASGHGHLRVAVAGGVVLIALAGSAVAAWYDRAGGTGVPNALTAGFAAAATAVIGAAVTLAVPGNLVGDLLLAAGAAWAVGEGMTEAGVYGVRSAPGTVPGATVWAALGPGFRALGFVLAVTAVPLVFPDGRLPGSGRPWRWLAGTAVGAAVLLFVGSAFGPFGGDVRLADWPDPLGLPPQEAGLTDAAAALGVALAVITVVGAVIGLVRRWRRDDPAVRQQLLLLALAACPPSLLVLVPITTPDAPPRWAFGLAVLPLPVAIAVAMLGYGLYDLRRATHRTLLWCTLSGAVVLLYAAVVVTASLLVPGDQGWFLHAFAAVAAALLLMPLRGALQRLVTRVVYGSWQEPYRMLAALGAHLEAADDVDRLLEATVSELTTGLQLDDVGLDDADGSLVAGVAPSPGVPTTTVPLTAYGRCFGELRFRTPARRFGSGDQQLVHDLARQLGAALHARRLRTDLQHARERLVLAREEERRRLRRELHDGVGPALAGLGFKLETARLLLPPGASAAARQLGTVREELRRTVTDVRRVVEGLRPPALDELGLVGACAQAVERLTDGSGVLAEIDADAVPPLPAAVEVAAYRIVVEGVTNAVRHAGARRCTVRLAVDGAWLVIDVSDDGSGLLPSPRAGSGLVIMRERAEELGGALTLDGTGRGLTVHAGLPLDVVPARPVPA
ncbi:MAG: sensor histidine kinase [Blastococcus sp.]